jgi:hypothetical protein
LGINCKSVHSVGSSKQGLRLVTSIRKEEVHEGEANLKVSRDVENHGVLWLTPSTEAHLKRQKLSVEGWKKTPV